MFGHHHVASALRRQEPQIRELPIRASHDRLTDPQLLRESANRRQEVASLQPSDGVGALDLLFDLNPGRQRARAID